MVPENDEATQDSSKKGKGTRGFFGKLMDKTIGTKEEREAHRREEAMLELDAQRARYAEEQALHDQRYRAGPSCRRYGPPPGDPYMRGYGPEYGRGYGYGYEDYPGDSRCRRRRRRRNFGGGGLGDLAGGLLLAGML